MEVEWHISVESKGELEEATMKAWNDLEKEYLESIINQLN